MEQRRTREGAEKEQRRSREGQEKEQRRTREGTEKEQRRSRDGAEEEQRRSRKAEMERRASRPLVPTTPLAPFSCEHGVNSVFWLRSQKLQSGHKSDLSSRVVTVQNPRVSAPK